MDIREKLVELLGSLTTVQVFCDMDGDPVSRLVSRVVAEEDIDGLADHLIANNVTVQEWIPVSERFPKPFVYVLVQMPGEDPCPTVREGFITRDGIWHSALYDREPDEVTHWMPMPQPPKGDSV